MITHYQGTVLDITERKETEEALHSALKKTKYLEFVINSSPVVVFLWKAEPDWPVEFVSDNIMQFGYKPEDLLSGLINYGDIIHPDDREYVRSAFKNKPGEVDVGFTVDYRILTKFGDSRWVNERTLIQRDENGNPTYLQGIILDITERKEAEEALRLDEARLEAILKLNQMAGASLQEITDFAREEAVRLTESKLGYLAFMSADESALMMHSWSKEAMKECEIQEKKFIYPIETTGIWGEAVRQRKPIITNDFPAPSPLKKGYPKGHVELTRHMNIPVFEGDRIVAVAGVGNKEEDYDESDVRQLNLLMQGMWKLIQRKQLEDGLRKYSEELSKADSKLRSLDRMKADFLSNLKGADFLTEYGELMDDETLDVIDDQQKKAIGNVVNYSQRLRRLVDSFLYRSLEEAGKIEYNFSPVAISEIVETSLLNTILMIDEKDIDLEKVVPEDLPLINGDEEKLIDMLTTLVDNAIRFTPPKGELLIEVCEEEENLHIMIKDSGAGIPEYLMPHLFQRFQDISGLMARNYQSLESGLYICKNIVDAHKGKIKVESEKDVGTTVHIWLPK